MAQRDRFLPPNVAESEKRLEQELRPFWRDYARPVNVFFPTASTTRQVAHGLGTVPDGYLIVRASGPAGGPSAAIAAVTPEKWTADLALLTATAGNTRAILIFFSLREDPIDV